MTRETAESTSHILPRALGLRDLVLFNIVAVLSLRWLATSAATGPSALTLWVLAGVLFFVPQGLAVSDLAHRYPEEGGIYFWTKRAFGEGHGFLCGWCYWVNNILYYPNLLLSTAVIATYAIGRGDSGLADDRAYAFFATLIMLWLAVWLNIVGVSTGKWLQNAGAFGTYLPGLVLAGLAFTVALHHPPANPITLHSLVPDLTKFGELNLWASIAFAFAGLELVGTLGGEIKDPTRTLPRSIFLAAPLIAMLYLGGTLSVLWLVPAKDVNIVSGPLQAIAVGAGALSWVVPVAAASYVLGNLGGVGAWLIGPARVAFTIGLDRYFPAWFGKVHPRWKTPYVAILAAAVLATGFLALSVVGKGTTVEKAYLILLDTMLLVYFVPFIYLFLIYLKTRLGEPAAPAHGIPPRSKPLAVLVGLAGLFLTLFAMGVAMVPPSDSGSVWLFELKVVGGASAFLVVGGLVYWRGKRPEVRKAGSGHE